MSRIKHGDGIRWTENYYLYQTWKNIKHRCYNPKLKHYHNYGGRGITMHEEWFNDYVKFKDYILTNLGERPYNLTLDRINNDGNYEPNNLRWSSMTIQNINKRKYVCKPRTKGGKLTEILVSKIKNELKDGIGGSALARKYNVSPMSITFIKQNKTWQHVI